MNIDIKMTGIDEVMKMLDPKKVRDAANSALNKVAAQAKTEASKLIREEYNLPASTVSKNLSVTTRAYGDKMEAVLSGFKKGMPLSNFGAKQSGVIANKKGFQFSSRAKQSGNLRHGGAVSVEVKRGGRKTVSGEPKTFMTKFKSGHIAVVQREGKGRFPIKQLLGPGISTLFGSKKIMDATKKLINDKFNDIFNHELEWRLKK